MYVSELVNDASLFRILVARALIISIPIRLIRNEVKPFSYFALLINRMLAEVSNSEGDR